ncbi:MAG: CHAT domain-containing protein [Planctomycetes bacterium]|nr:CHAT domain-containing protein [Planctomycetota bacterium]
MRRRKVQRAHERDGAASYSTLARTASTSARLALALAVAGALPLGGANASDPMGRVVAEFQEAERQEAVDAKRLAALRRREWDCLQRRDSGQAAPGELAAVRRELIAALAASGRRAAAARLAVELLREESPAEVEARLALLELALAEGESSELDERAKLFERVGLLEEGPRLALVERFLQRGAIAPAERLLEPFRRGAPDASGAAAALRARVAMAHGRRVAAAALLEAVLEAPGRAGAIGAQALLAGALDARARGELARAESLAAVVDTASLAEPAERCSLALLRSALARRRGDLDGAAQALEALASLPLRAGDQRARAIEAARVELARGALDAAAQLAAGADDEVEGEARASLGVLRAELALARGDAVAARAAYEGALPRACWSSGDAAGEALEGWAALLASTGEELSPALGARLGIPELGAEKLLLEIALHGPQRSFLARWSFAGLSLAPLAPEAAASRGGGARAFDASSAPAAERLEDAPHAIWLDAELLALHLARAELALEDGREFLGFAGPLAPGRDDAAPVVEEELRAVAQCFQAAEQRLHLAEEATVERLRAAAGRGGADGEAQRYRVLHLVARATASAGAARLSLQDAEERAIDLDLARCDEEGRSPLPLADLCVLSLYADQPLERAQLEPWARSLLAHGARAVLIGARGYARDEDARRELGLFYAALAEGESAAAALARTRPQVSELEERVRFEPIFRLYGDGSLRARGWSPPNLAVLAPEAVRRPWWIYFVTALVLPAVVFLLFRRLSTGRVRARV